MPEDPLSNWSLVVAANSESVLHNTLLASPALGSECQIIVERGFLSAGKAYNAGLKRARNDIVVFAHQDVYLPEAWKAGLSSAIQQLARIEPAWAVLGSFGVTSGTPPRLKGYCYSTGLGRILGEPFSAPVSARTLDELVLVVRRSSGLTFDEQLPGFHLYGTDICLAAKARGLGSYIVPAFCIHNSNGIRRLPSEFWQGYFYLRHKWWNVLPVTTCCTTITKACLPVARRVFEERMRHRAPQSLGTRCADVASLYRELCDNRQQL